MSGSGENDTDIRTRPYTQRHFFLKIKTQHATHYLKHFSSVHHFFPIYYFFLRKSHGMFSC